MQGWFKLLYSELSIPYSYVNPVPDSFIPPFGTISIGTVIGGTVIGVTTTLNKK